MSSGSAPTSSITVTKSAFRCIRSAAGSICSPKGTLNTFVYLQNHGREGARGNQKLWMGPWAHSALNGDLAFPGERGGLEGAFGDEMRWFDAWLKGAKNGIREEPPVTYYHMAAARKGEVSPKNEFTHREQLAAREPRDELLPDAGWRLESQSANGSEFSDGLQVRSE